MDGFWSEGSAIPQVETGAPGDPLTIAARAYLEELAAAYGNSAAMITGILNGIQPTR